MLTIPYLSKTLLQSTSNAACQIDRPRRKRLIALVAASRGFAVLGKYDPSLIRTYIQLKKHIFHYKKRKKLDHLTEKTIFLILKTASNIGQFVGIFGTI